MRKSRVIAFVIASLVSTASFAQAQTAAPHARGDHQGMRAGMKGGRGHDGALKGMKLSDAEKAKLKAVHGKYAAESKSLREKMKPAMQEARAARQKGDTATMKAIRARSQGVRDQMKALHDRQQAEIRGSLSAENQKQLDANIATRAQRRAEWAKNGGKKGMPGMKGMKRNSRGE